MNQKALSRWLKGIVLGMGVCGLILYFLVIPIAGDSLVVQYPEFSGRFWPWMIFLWLTAVPCYAVLFWGWSIASEIGQDRSFTLKNARSLKWIMVAAIGDTVLFFYWPTSTIRQFYWHRFLSASSASVLPLWPEACRIW